MKFKKITDLLPNIPTKVYQEYEAYMQSNPYDADPSDYFWDQVTFAILAADKITEKKWGFEASLVNNDKFCGKFLIYWAGGYMSKHLHRVKEEIFIVREGKLGLSLHSDEDEKNSIIGIGDKILLKRGTFHSLEAFENSVVLEISTFDSPEDNERITESCYTPNNQDNIKNYR